MYHTDIERYIVLELNRVYEPCGMDKRDITGGGVMIWADGLPEGFSVLPLTPIKELWL